MELWGDILCPERASSSGSEPRSCGFDGIWDESYVVPEASRRPQRELTWHSTSLEVAAMWGRAYCLQSSVFKIRGPYWLNRFNYLIIFNTHASIRFKEIPTIWKTEFSTKVTHLSPRLLKHFSTLHKRNRGCGATNQ